MINLKENKITVIANEVKQSNQIATPYGLAMTEQAGRSMVEMLGVLAVIGVLSVAGIAGYNTAMQSYRTNKILNATSMFYVLAMSQNQGNGPSGKITYSAVGGTDPSGATLEYESNAITITFNDAKDCTMAKNKLGDKATGECPTLTVSFGEETPELEYSIDENNVVTCKSGNVLLGKQGKIKCFQSESEGNNFCDEIIQGSEPSYGAGYEIDGFKCYECYECYKF